MGTPPRVFRGAASALFFRDTARQAVALLMFRDMVMRPRKGDFAFLFVNRTDFVRFILLFRFR